MANSFLQRLAISQPPSDTLQGERQEKVAKSRTKSAALEGFGAVLQDAAKGRKISDAALARIVAEKVKPLGLTVDPATLWRWKKGQVQSVNPIILQAFGEVLGLDLLELLAVLEANLRDRAMSGEAGRQFLRRRRSDLRPKTFTSRSGTAVSPEPEVNKDTAELTIRVFPDTHAKEAQTQSDPDTSSKIEHLPNHGWEESDDDVRSGKPTGGPAPRRQQREINSAFIAGLMRSASKIDGATKEMGRIKNQLRQAASALADRNADAAGASKRRSPRGNRGGGGNPPSGGEQ